MTTPKEILRLIEQAAREGRTQLDLSGQGLTSVPPEIVKLTNLTRLNLRSNLLTELPLEITTLTKLTSLDLSLNTLTSLPREISNLSNLTRLSLWSNRLKSVPAELFDLTKLKELYLDNNELRDVPANINKLTRLRVLNLHENRFKSVPTELADIANLQKLSLGGNPLTKMVIGAIPANLTELYVPKLNLTRLPPEISILTSLRVLVLNRNKLASFPPEIIGLTNLRELELSENLLTSVPAEIVKLTNLTNLNLTGNPLPISPETLANPKDVKAIFAAIAGFVTGERLNEAKMLVVGDGKVGKSSVVERLLHGTFNPQKQTTLGVEIKDEMKVLQSEIKGEGEPVKLNIWDFGGQEIQHSTHQFFLTTRSLYLLVVDARKGDQLSTIEYWLKLIVSFAGDSPIIVVINQIDQLKGQRPLNLDRKALQEKYQIKDFVETSCETGEGIPTLRTAIAREVEHLKHVRDIWPSEWIAIKQRLREMKKDYIPVETYEDICTEENLNDPDLRQSLLGLLHDLGVVIRFPGDTQVLNPRWVTQGVYGLLTSEQLVTSVGQFDLKDMGAILDNIPQTSGRYPSYTHHRLIDVMQHFQLCFEFTDRPGHYLIPRHLHDNEPDIQWDDAGALRFQYHYETLPDSVISRFIVHMNYYITEPHYWKNGVFLESSDGEKNRAKIKADLVDRKIFISVVGKEQTRRAFLAVVRSAFDKINSNFKIEIKQMIPISDSPEVLVSYKDLLAYEEMGEEQIVIPELLKKFPVRELLDGVEDLSTRMRRRENNLRSNPSSNAMPEAIQSKSQTRILRVVVASPADVKPERDLLPAVIDEVNRGVAADRNLRLELSRWETDAYPGFHAEGPQGLIDPILNITDCDLLIGIFWKRFGTPTTDSKTGTEHEFNLAHKAWKEKQRPQIFIYFNQKSYTPKSKDEAEQWGRVLEFREKFPKEGLWWPYKGKANFEKLVRTQLTNYIRTLDY